MRSGARGSVVLRLVKAGADLCAQDGLGRLPIEAAPDEETRCRVMAVLHGCCSPEQLLAMHARLVSRRVLREVLAHFKKACPVCKRSTSKCARLRKENLVWWMHVHRGGDRAVFIMPRDVLPEDNIG
jgi:hypothetical protein